MLLFSLYLSGLENEIDRTIESLLTGAARQFFHLYVISALIEIVLGAGL